MNPNDYLDLFLAESTDLLEAARRQLRAAAPGRGAGAARDELYRHLHSLKGMAATMGKGGMAELCHLLEEVLNRARGAPASWTAVTARDLRAGLEEIGTLLDRIGAGEAEPEPAASLLARLRRPAAAGSAQPAGSRRTLWEIAVRLDAGTPLPAARALVIRKQVEGLGEVRAMKPTEAELRAGASPDPLRFLLRTTRAGAAIEAALGALAEVRSCRVRKRRRAPRPAGRSPARAVLPESVRVQMSQLDRLLDTAAEIGIERERLFREIGAGPAHPARDGLDRLRRAIDRLRSQVMELRLVPFGSIADRLKDAALELAERRGKRVAIEIVGAEISLDRSTLDRLLDPLQHLLRNCVDHGIETAAERTAAGKDPIGRLTLTVSRAGPELDVVLRDDGGGIDPEEIRRRAVEGGWLERTEAERLDRAGLLGLITRPGFSTAERADEVSGRGMGMDVVSTRIGAMGGSLDLDSRPGRGTTFRIRLPLTVALLDGFLVRARSGWFALPLHQVEETIMVPGGNGDRMPVVSLDRILGATGVETDGGPPRPALVVRGATGRFGLIVEAILGRREFVLRGLGRPLEALPEVTGATILENGRVALLLNARSLEPPGTRPG